MSQQNIMGVTTQLVSLTDGATNAVLVGNCAGAQSTAVKYASGHSLIYLFGIPAGMTALTGSSLVAGYSAGWPLGTEILSFDGNTRFYLASVGGDAVVALMRGLSSGQ